jgi:hypothetical protein
MKTKKLIKKPNKLIKKTKRIQKSGGFFFTTKNSLINKIKKKIANNPEIIKIDKIITWTHFFESLSKEELDSISIEELKAITIIDDSNLLNKLKLLEEKINVPIIEKIKQELDKNKKITEEKRKEYKLLLDNLSYQELKTIIKNNISVLGLNILLDKKKYQNKIPLEGPRQDNKNTKEKTTLVIYKPKSFLYFNTELPELPKFIYLKKYLIENLFVIGDELKYLINNLFIPEYNINLDFRLPNKYLGFDFDKNNRDVSFVFQSQTDGDSGIEILENYINKQYLSKKSKFGLLIEKIPSPEIKVLLKSLIDNYMFMIRDLNKYLSQIIVKLPLVIEEYIKIFTYILNINIFLCQILYHHLKIKDYKHLDNYDDIQKIFTLIENSKISYDSYKSMLDPLPVEFKRIMPKSKSTIQEQIRNNTSNNDNKQKNSTTILKFDSKKIVYFQEIKNLYDIYIKLKTAIKTIKVKDLENKRQKSPNTVVFNSNNGSMGSNGSNSSNTDSIISLENNNLAMERVLKRNPNLSFNNQGTFAEV